MPSHTEMIEQAFEVLRQRPGFVERPDQRQLALLISDLISEKSSGAFEAPTGLGKSLASLIPAIAHAIANRRRVVIATYTNVLAEQYWRNDLPLALTLFPDQDPPRTQLLMGRARYACLAAVEEHAPELTDELRAGSPLGIETEFRRAVKRPARELSMLWQKVASPPVCPGRLCPAYDDCYYYSARKQAAKAEIVITNHSVVIQDALMKREVEDGEGLLGAYDFLILDEAHDFARAATNGLEFELSLPKLNALAGIAVRMESLLMPLAQRCGDGGDWARLHAKFRESVDACQRSLIAYNLSLGRPGILTAAPGDLLDHPQVKNMRTTDHLEAARDVADEVSRECDGFVVAVRERLDRWQEFEPERVKQATETTRNYLAFIGSFGLGCHSLFTPSGVSVSYSGRQGNDSILRQDVIGLSEPLRELIWDKVPSACLSATLATDGNFDFFRRSTGAQPAFEEILATPFDYGSQAAIYIPPDGTIPDPTTARRDGNEDAYYRALAREISHIIRACGGRTLGLFHSRKEMEAVLSYLDLPSELPVLVQTKFGAGAVGERFRSNTASSLFALRSFWTGFDAPGETLSCVILVRVPFEVPIDPPQIARLAWLQQQGVDPFRDHTLALAKMMMRQGAGRLIRNAEDRGIIALLDSRLLTKRYGEEIIDNLPRDMRTYRDIDEAVGFIGLS